MDALIQLGITGALLLLGFFFGARRERNHFEEIKRREKNLLHLPLHSLDSKTNDSVQQAFMVTGSVVIASDYFKNFVGAIRNFLGGRLTSHESLMDRARREAVLRLKESAASLGATEILNLRLEFSTIDQMGVEVLAYATAIKK